MLSFEDVKIILAIVKFGNFSKASEILFMTQSSLSKKVKNIEEKLGYKIFVRGRGKKTVELTERGEELIPIINDIKRLYIDAEHLKYKDLKIKLSIASSDGPYFFVIEDSILELYGNNPQIFFKLKNLSYRECIRAVSDETVDVAFVGNNIYKKNLSVFPLYEEQMVFITLNQNQTKEKVNISDLDINKAIYSPYSSEYTSWFWYTFENEQPIFRCDLIEQVITYMKTLNLWSIVPISAAKYIAKKIDIKILPIDEDIPNRIIYYAVKTGQNKKVVDDLLNVMRKRLRNQDGIYLYDRS